LKFTVHIETPESDRHVLNGGHNLAWCLFFYQGIYRGALTYTETCCFGIKMPEDHYKILSPAMKLDDLADLQKLLVEPEVKKALRKADKTYLHWESLRYKTWIPTNFFPQKERFWSLVRINRYFGSQATPIRDVQGRFFRINIGNYSEILHIIDKEMAGNFMGIPQLSENDKRLVVKPWDDKKIAYTAPDKEFVENELPKLIAFANNEDGEFIHPLIKAIMLHFWIGLLHPFEDGNGRLARILFYWYMLRHDYWAFAYLSLSEKIKKSPKQYAMAYIYSEQEGCDLTYFINYNIEKLKLARTEFQNYIQNKVKENQSIISLGQQKYNFNERQIKLLQYFHQKVESRTNIIAHQKLYSIKKGTAVSDLKTLVEKGFLVKKKQGKNVFYYPTKKISTIFKFD
jgi:hypothetical protein